MSTDQVLHRIMQVPYPSGAEVSIGLAFTITDETIHQVVITDDSGLCN